VDEHRDEHAPDDPLDALIAEGVRTPAESPGRTTPFPHVGTNADLGAMLDADGGRLDEPMRGESVSSEQIASWADEAEAGYDPDELKRYGRRTGEPGGGTA
jgi:hypothetical protein